MTYLTLLIGLMLLIVAMNRTGKPIQKLVMSLTVGAILWVVLLPIFFPKGFYPPIWIICILIFALIWRAEFVVIVWYAKKWYTKKWGRH
jgi:hypothetical protein